MAHATDIENKNLLKPVTVRLSTDRYARLAGLYWESIFHTKTCGIVTLPYATEQEAIEARWSDLTVGDRVVANTSQTFNRRSKIERIYTNEQGKLIYVLADGGFFGRGELEKE